MPEPEEENPPSSVRYPNRVENRDYRSLMDLDLELDSSWPLDQISFLDPPCWPLWAFSDDVGIGKSAGGFGLNNYPGLSVSCNPNLETENLAENDNKRKLPPPVFGLNPSENSDGYCIIKERMTQALRYFKESTEQHVLAQVWAPVKNGDRYVLTTSGQPFVLGTQSHGLHQYRMVSLRYSFSVDEENEGDLGLPGRVFRQKLPEWTPNVQYYSSKEYSRLKDALHHDVRGSLALPVFEPSGQACVGVLELIMTSQKINYAPEVDKVCKALEAVNLKSSDILDHPNRQICNEGRQDALAEILEILTLVCETHKLPLAQTWVPCRHRSVLSDGGGLRKSCSSFDGSCMGQVCMSTTDVAFYVVDAHMWGFWEACTEHHLQKGQGVAGRAFLSQNSCFCSDITRFCKTEYPLVHYARLFGLTGCFAICVRSSHTGNDDYVLEFFLPPSVKDRCGQEALLGLILGTMKQQFKSLAVASGVEPRDDERFVEIIEGSVDDEKIDSRVQYIPIPGNDNVPNGVEIERPDSSKQLLTPNFIPTSDLGGVDVTVNPNPARVPENKEKGKKSERKRGKTEKTISLDVLQHYFTGSLKDAAKSLGVCPTTMKRICRQHGISRWPSRKINKVNRSLTKLKGVIDSVQGAEGSFGLTSLATSPLPVAVGSISWPASVNGSHQHDSPNPKPFELHGENFEMPISRKSVEKDENVGKDQFLLGGRTLNQEELAHVQSMLQPNSVKRSSRSKTRSGSREESAGTPTSHGSCQGSPGNEPATAKEPLIPSMQEPFGELNLSGGYGILAEDAGSSKDLRNLCPSSHTVTHVTARQEMRSVTIKATYRQDIIRFRISLSSGILELKEEAAKRLKLEVGTFDIKYLDDDHEWVLIACDADLQECMDISRSSGNNIIRLLIHDIMSNLGSSCESCGE